MNSQRSAVRGQRSEPNSQLSTSDTQHSIEVYIEQLVLHGFARGAHRQIGEALEAELRGILLERGIPATWQNNPEKLEAVSTFGTLTNPNTASNQIAKAIYGSNPAKPAGRHSPRSVKRIK
jgi:hypothetical protein